MVKPFLFSRIPRISFKTDQISNRAGFIKSYGSGIILVTGQNSFLHSMKASLLFSAFEQKDIEYQIVKIAGEPSPEIIDKTVASLNGISAEVVVAIGGGSVIDAGKAISAMMFKKESVIDYLEGVGTIDHPGTKLPFIAVPTTSGTGSEATKNAVISSIGKEGFKKSLRHENFVPDIAVVDPELTVSCPVNITAASGMDCFTQLTESYLSDKSNEYTDALAYEGLKVIKSSLRRSFLNGDDIEARTGMSFAALTSGICLANAGLGVVHGFASSIGGLYNIPHGVVCGTLMTSANKLNVRNLRKTRNNNSALKKYAILGRLFLDEEGKSDHYYTDGFIRYLSDLSDEFHLSLLGEYGLENNAIEHICRLTENKNNPVKLTLDELMEIIGSRL
jgi:alcohol dehydrogenase class IV